MRQTRNSQRAAVQPASSETYQSQAKRKKAVVDNEDVEVAPVNKKHKPKMFVFF